MSNVADWRKLVINDDIHYCEVIETLWKSQNQVVKRGEVWLFKSNKPIHNDMQITPEQMRENWENNHFTEIHFCPFCGVNLKEYIETNE